MTPRKVTKKIRKNIKKKGIFTTVRRQSGRVGLAISKYSVRNPALSASNDLKHMALLGRPRTFKTVFHSGDATDIFVYVRVCTHKCETQ